MKRRSLEGRIRRLEKDLKRLAEEVRFQNKPQHYNYGYQPDILSFSMGKSSHEPGRRNTSSSSIDNGPV